MIEDTPGASRPTLSLGACGVNRISTNWLIGKCPLHLQSSTPVTTRLSSEPPACPLVIAHSSRRPRTNVPPGSMELARKEASPRRRGRRLSRDRGRRSSCGPWFLLIASQVGVSSHRSCDLGVNSKGRENQY